jgi:tetratricopeptide (TPR) repeat protein
MKPRAFVGSSVEGLQVAYAVQQNLLHDVEVTVWDQGVFELSATTIESLTRALSNTDFGIFVFSPDDTLRMRGAEAKSVRDNVLFELGLFIGKLGRERVFFLMPSDSPPHIPSDLLGITPAKYETNRADGSFQAATGPACHQMRQLIRSLGPINPPESTPSPAGESGKQEPESLGWLGDFIAQNYAEARAKLEASIPEKNGEDALEARAWMYYCDFKLDEAAGLKELIAFAEAHPASVKVQTLAAQILRLERETDRAVRLLEAVDASISEDLAIKLVLSLCYVTNAEHDKAIQTLSVPSVVAEPRTALALADVYQSQERFEEAIGVVHDAHMQHPRDRDLKFKYARLAQELEQDPVATYFLDELTKEKEDSIEYWGYLANSCLALDLYDRALYAYRKAESLIDSHGDDEWILSNIGNLFKNKDLPSEAIGYLERAIKGDPDSEYAHDRLAQALKMRGEELKVYKAKITEGVRLVKKREAERRASVPEIPGLDTTL